MNMEDKKELDALRVAINGINTIMWEGFMVKKKGFSQKDGLKIMEILNQTSAKYD